MIMKMIMIDNKIKQELKEFLDSGNYSISEKQEMTLYIDELIIDELKGESK